MYSANVTFKLQNYSGDANGNLNGNFTIAAGASDSQTGFAMVSVNTKLIAGENPIDALNAALLARKDMPTLTEIQTSNQG